MKLDRALTGLGAVTIDVDTLGCYRAIHGLPARDDEADPIYAIALPRFLDVMDRLGVSATLFVIGQDLERSAHRELLASAHARGHEVASHSFAHDYHLSRQPHDVIASDLQRADDAIARATGERPVGFRAPGYNQSDTLLDVIEELGYVYDSSYFPTPAYFAARAAASWAAGSRQTRSSSLRGSGGGSCSNPMYP